VIYVVDTAVLIDHLRGDPRASSLLTATVEGGHALWSVTPVRTEVLAGMRKGEEQSTRDLLDALSWQPVTVEIADNAGALARRFMKSHSGVDTIDYLIAAGTLSLGGRLLTTNVRHFPMFPKIEPAY
jgi:predicted nucleic acid-binding protein